MSDVRPGIAGGLWAALILLVTKVVVEPIREGRLRDVRIPLGLRPVVVVAIAGYSVAVLLIVGAGVIRSTFELFSQAASSISPVPRFSIWLLFVLMALALSIGQTGAIHARAWVRWAVTGYTVLALGFLGALDTEGGQVGRVVAFVTSLGLVLLVALRGHRSFVWWEFPIVAALVFGSIGSSILFISSRGATTGFDFVPLLFATVLGAIGTLAAPLTIASGAAVAELAVSTATWIAGAFRDRTARTVLIIALALVVVWRVFELVPAVGRVIDNPEGELVTLAGSVGFLGVAGAGWFIIGRLAREAPAPTVTVLVKALSTVSLLIAAFLTLMVPIGVLSTIGGVLPVFGVPLEVSAAISVVTGILSSSVALAIVRMTLGAVLVVLAFVLARRGRRGTPEIFLAVGIASLVGGVLVLVNGPALWAGDSLALMATLAALALLVWTVITRRATLDRLAGITATLLLAALFAHADFLSDPLGAILGSTAVAAVLVGLAWSLLTGNAAANEGSPHYPRPSRVLLLLANALLAVTTLAFVALTRDTTSAFDLSVFAELGAITFGYPLIVVSLLAAVTSSIRDRPFA
ncbi:hypothetical protein [Antiquaquibacter soli]|uniref:DUF2339 domain-containing protein n=1 Tax=Antiquaquibacter soli TaxID=3064523 RepID=A0ABT9BUN6_9MICO|nr:hypothetical protein [Protaetiibacter sp. WY-16]MDO7883496.1 hypothetical protein [Protaetiibacter sp. WY-16]